MFLSCRGVSGGEEADAFAPAGGGEPLSVGALGKLCKRIGRKVGIPRLHPHLLRHTFACLHLLRYRDPFALKSLLGHTTLTMTQHYCDAVQQMEVVRADKVSVVDGLDACSLEVKRSGRPKRTKAASPTTA